MNDIAGTHELHVHDTGRYDGWTLDDIISALRGATLQQLKRGTLTALIARREWGGMLVAASKLVTTFAEQLSLFHRVVNLAYPDARMHMSLWSARVARDESQAARALHR